MRVTKRRTRITATLAVLAIAACAPAATVNGQTEEAAIRAADAAFLAGVTARNVDQLVTWYAPDATLIVPNSPMATGTAAIRNNWSEFLKMPGLSFSFSPTRIDVINADAATEVGTYKLSFNGPQGQVNDAGTYSVTWRKINGQWRIVTDAAVSSTPMPTMGGAPMPMAMPPMEVSDMEIRSGAGLTWAPLSVPGFDPGARIAVLHGDPGSKGDYTLRLEFPDGYRFPVHWHPGGEHLTVLSGTFLLGTGSTANASALKTYKPGDFLFIPARHPHYGGATGRTVIQLHGIGPFAINLGTPK